MERGGFRYLDALTTGFVVVLLVSNLVAQKVCQVGPFVVSGALLLFPVTYIFGDVFTEVYGFAASRRAIWLGFFGTALLYAMGAVTIALPSAPGWQHQEAFRTVFGFIPRILGASLVAFWAGEFANSYTMARMKIWTEGRMLWTRTVGSTVVGQAVDTTLVVSLTFAGVVAWGTIGKIIVEGYLLKVAYEVLATPLTYAVIGWLKRAEGVDAFDREESFSPFFILSPSAARALGVMVCGLVGRSFHGSEDCSRRPHWEKSARWKVGRASPVSSDQANGTAMPTPGRARVLQGATAVAPRSLRR